MDIVISAVLTAEELRPAPGSAGRPGGDGGFDPIKPYRPELHDMRTPAPNWREQHASGRLSGIR